MSIQKLSIQWNDIVLDITYNSNSFNGYKEVYGHGMTHLIIRSIPKRPFPGSTSGERCRYTPETLIDEYGGAAGFVKAWLDEAAQSKEWQTYLRESMKPKQLTLF